MALTDLPKWCAAKLGAFLLSITPSCEHITRYASDELEDRLSYGRRLQVRLHCLACTLCERYVIQLRGLHELTCVFHEHLDEVSQDELQPQVKADLKRKMTTRSS